MKTVVAIYTGQGLAEPLQAAFNEMISGGRLVNVIDDGLIHDVNNSGGVTPKIVRRLLRYYENAEEMGADVILNTCSSVGEIATVGRTAVSVPIVRIDEAMAEDAVRKFSRIGVIATLPSTLQPTKELLRTKALELEKSVTLVEGLASGAYQALIEGNSEKHDEGIVHVAKGLAKQVDLVVLAQASMARMQDELEQQTGIPVLSSLRSGLAAVKSVLEAV
ncbi:aspartate/glutamate racemase family protein [Alicyclobacillus sp. SO9]|uniref:aspartate/glutamate racemase family protein n=1 Tax=Alicyclobacillus sp. SO9 TaxID=2665646 RepID=UPI0018E7DF44|nr:aspartate/glutamate racemase family protein [Alicyclobacillus sp. SO9]QQE77965.1 Asp/Glu/hydantoin racemase [Alicyclobacillus sp. SO9]